MRLTRVSTVTVNVPRLPLGRVVSPVTGERASRAASAEIRAQARPPLVAAAQATDRVHAWANARRAVTTVVVYHGSRSRTW